MSGTVALTGATGFIGGRIVQRLRADGWSLRALVRDPAKAVALAEQGVELVRGSLSDSDALQRLVQGADAVVHCAGAVRGISLEDFERVNVAGVAAVLKAARAATRSPRLLFLSSLAAREPALSHYAASKCHGEQLLQREAVGLEWVALRPPAVYGPGDKELLPLFRWMRRGLAPIVGDRNGRFSMLFVDDLAAAVAQWLAQGQGVSGVFEIDDGQPNGYNWDEIVQAAAQQRGAGVRQLPIPGLLLRGIGAVSVAMARVGGYAPMLSPGKVRELRHPDWVCDSGPWQRALAWRPAVRFDEGLRRTLAA